MGECGLQVFEGRTYIRHRRILQKLSRIIVLQRFEARIVVFEISQRRVSDRIIEMREELGVFVPGFRGVVFFGGAGGRGGVLGLGAKTERFECGKGFSQCGHCGSSWGLCCVYCVRGLSNGGICYIPITSSIYEAIYDGRRFPSVAPEGMRRDLGMPALQGVFQNTRAEWGQDGRG